MGSLKRAILTATALGLLGLVA
jgi:hypothetical protein